MDATAKVNHLVADIDDNALNGWFDSSEECDVILEHWDEFQTKLKAKLESLREQMVEAEEEDSEEEDSE